MARLFPGSSSSSSSCQSSDLPATGASIASSPPPPPALPSPLPDLGVALSAADLRATAYEVLVAASRATGAKPLTYIPQSASSSLLHRTAAAGKTKGALGPGSSASSDGGRAAAARPRRPVAEHVRVRLGVTEQADARIRRGLLRIAAGQLGKHAESMVLPLEFLQKFKASDFPDPLEYEAWETRNFKLLEAGLLVHPLVPLKKSDISAQRLRKIIGEAYNGQLETGWNSQSMQRLRRAAMSLACRSLTETSDECHWADGFPLNLHIYKMLVEACFDDEDGTILDEIDEVMELLKKTWVILGVNQILHNLCFTWALFNHFVISGQADNELLSATDNLLVQVIDDAKMTEDPDYCDILSSTLSLIMGWTEKRLLAYHETFSTSNIDSMPDMVSIAISTAMILVENMSYDHQLGTKEQTEVVHGRIATYIRSSVRTAFAQKLEEADSKRLSWNHVHVLSILAKEVGDIATKEKNLYSPVLKKWHPLAAGVAIATLHACFGSELKQYIIGLRELTPDAAQVLKAADKLEKDLFHIAIEESMDSDDGGKSLIKEMLPYETGTVLDNMVKAWVKERVEKLKGWTDQNIQQETWNPKANNMDNLDSSSVEMLRIINENLDAFFQLPISMHSTLLPDLKIGFDRCLQFYVSKVKSGCGTRGTLFPQLPHLTRCDVGSKLFKNKEKPQFFVKQGSQVGSDTGNEASSLPGLCARINTLHHLKNELGNLDNKMKTYLRSVSAQPDTADGLDINFQQSLAACQDGIRQLCEATGYKVIFNDLSHVLLDTLYVGSPASNRILSLLKELGPILKFISATVHNRVRNRLITALMKASFDGFLLVLLAGGPARAFSCEDYQIIEDDFRALRGLYLTYGESMPEELVVKSSLELKNILPLLRTDTPTLIGRFKQAISESYGSTDKSRFPMPPVPTQWSPNNPNTILRVLCYRKDEAASKFLKQTYDLPKTL